MASVSELMPLFDEMPEDGSVFVSGCATEVSGLAELLGEVAVTKTFTVSGIFLPGLNRCNYAAFSERIRCRTFFMTPQLAASPERVEYCPWRYRDIVRHYEHHPVDVAVVMLSPPDEEGFCSYGVSSDFAPLVLPHATVRLGVINHQMPRVRGARIALSELHKSVEINVPLLESREITIDEQSREIGRYVASFVSDGATIQLGLGSIPGAVANELFLRRDLRVQSGLIEHSILKLERAGVLDKAYPIIGGVALGDHALYRSIDDNPRMSFQPVSVTHDVGSMVEAEAFIAINGALEVDLLGQTNSFVKPDGFVSGPGGLPEFVNGALTSKNGRSVIALNATAAAGEKSRIVPRLSGGLASLSASEADVVATEFGVAELRDKSISQRIEAMIAIADPRHRAALTKAARMAYN